MCKDLYSSVSCLTDTSISEVAAKSWACLRKSFDNSVLSHAEKYIDSTELGTSYLVF